MEFQRELETSEVWNPIGGEVMVVVIGTEILVGAPEVFAAVSLKDPRDVKDVKDTVPDDRDVALDAAIDAVFPRRTGVCVALLDAFLGFRTELELANCWAPHA